MAETGTNYTTALRSHEAAVANLHAEDDAAAAGRSDVDPSTSAVAEATDLTLNLRFSGAPDPASTAERSD